MAGSGWLFIEIFYCISYKLQKQFYDALRSVETQKLETTPRQNLLSFLLRHAKESSSSSENHNEFLEFCVEKGYLQTVIANFVLKMPFCRQPC
mmetsp:Transcript_39001/g.70249  ORF Transcript_39001/g.70249 Transcript_39001/m.70249 type:complete len:93 (-) Transcript_39001:33-311(-)